MFNSLYTDVVSFFFSFFWKLNIGEHAGEARESERGTRERKKQIFSSSPNPCLLALASINPPQFIFYHARSTDFEEKIEGGLVFNL